MNRKRVQTLASSRACRRWISRVWILGYVLHCILFAQEAGVIKGRIETEQGDPVQQATVILFNETFHLRRETTTDTRGTYTFSQLPTGLYRLETSAPGYTSRRRDGIQVQPATVVEISLRLEPVQVQTIRELEARGEKERNPNIFIRKIDLYALRDPLRRRGIDPAFLEFNAVQNYYGADLGAPLRQIIVVQPGRPRRNFHGSWYETHQNSALNARPFFNVGPLHPSRRNQFGFDLSGPLIKDKLFFSTSLELVRESGFVNGNVRVPLLEERVPAGPDPQTNEIIAALLTGFPPQAPNLPNVTPRQLNTNAERDIDSEDWNLKIDYSASDQNHFAFQYAVTNYSEDPFEFVAGQNPQTDLRPQSFSAKYVRTWSPATVLQSSLYFDRFRGLLLATERFRSLLEPLGLPDVPDIDFGGTFADLTALGPGAQYPRKRFQTRFGGRVNLAHVRNRHHLRLGGQLMRVRLNDLQSDNSRGEFIFGDNFGRTAFENFLRGTATRFTITLGDLYRGFRHWEATIYAQDTYQARPGLALTFGLRYEVVTAPTEVNNLTNVGFDTDANNFAPQVGFAWNPGGSIVIRGGYGISFGQIFPGTFQLARFNPPAVRTITIQNPALVKPLKNLEITPGEPQRSELNLMSPDLVSPYAHQYNLVIEKNFSENLLFQVGYVGNRTLKSFFPFVSNRAEAVAGVPATTATIDERRPDPRFLSIKTIINSGMSYYDGLKVSLRRRFASNLAFDINYVFSKNLSSGFDFAATLNREVASQNSQNNTDFQADLRGPAAFDARNAFSINYTYELPFRGLRRRLPALLIEGWKITGTTEFRTGSWFDIATSSDAPGFGNVDGVKDDRPNITNPSILGRTVDYPDSSTSILKPESFNADIPPGGRGNLGLRVFRSDHLNYTNLALAKIFPLAGEKMLEFRTEFRNFFNHPRFKRPGDVFPSPVFGKIIDTQNKGRVMQFMLKVSF